MQTMPLLPWLPYLSASAGIMPAAPGGIALGMLEVAASAPFRSNLLGIAIDCMTPSDSLDFWTRP